MWEFYTARVIEEGCYEAVFVDECMSLTVPFSSYYDSCTHRKGECSLYATACLSARMQALGDVYEFIQSFNTPHMKKEGKGLSYKLRQRAGFAPAQGAREST